MSMIPEEVIEQIRDAADMVGIIGEAVQLKRMGADYRGPCPFHGGSNKNFAVIQKKGMYYCFVCHASGDIFTWLMRRFGMDYPTAVRDVARRVGIVIPETQSRQGPDPREPLFQAVAMAQDFFAKSLQEGEEAKEARAYLEGREIPLAMAGEWGLGYAPRGTALIDEMKRLGIEEPVLLEAGLLHQRDDGTLRARFRGRLQFPIHDVRGRVVGFGGRILGRGEPKYLNSPECPIFHKGSLLYHLHLAKGAIRREETALVVEGYFDVLRLYAAGIENVVAALGTALTTEQGATLRRYAKTAVLLYDSDKAGLRATFRSGDVLLGHGLLVKVVTLPPESDPDSIVRTKGVKALQALVRDAIDVLDRKLQLLDQRGWLSDVQRKREALDRLLPTLRAVSDPVVKDLYVGRVAERLGVSRETLMRELRSHPSAPMRRAESALPARVKPSPASRVEEQLLKILLAAARWRSRAREEVPPEWFENSMLRAIFSALVELPPDADAGDAAPNLPPDALPTFDRLREAGGGLAGLNLDEAYAATSDKLRDRIEFRRVGAMEDPEERRRAMAAWSEERTQHYSWHKAAGRGSRPARTPSSPQE
jgi:DNA primase